MLSHRRLYGETRNKVVSFYEGKENGPEHLSLKVQKRSEKAATKKPRFFDRGES